jgi:tellurite resistance protein TehA-like permease
MGALAISALAGDRLLAAAYAVHVTGWLPHAIRAVTLAAWILATLWIPLLLYMQTRSARHRRGPLGHAGAWWAAVFPLGMYSVATQATAVRFGAQQLHTVSVVVFWAAATAWLVVATGWLRATLAGRRRSAR